jgi:AraC-like DNA-binding protein
MNNGFEARALRVRIEQRHGQLCIVARSREAGPDLSIEANYSGGPEGVWFRSTEGGRTRVFSRDEVARHPAISAILRLIADEVDMARRPSEALLGSLFQSLHVYVSRMATPEPLPRWGRPFRHPKIERAVALLNEDISKRWTVALLARAVGLSRPAFARQFSEVMRLSPMRYLTERRMRVAAALLLESDLALAEVARRVGYDSEFAFSRAFKRHRGQPPGVFRRERPRPADFPERVERSLAEVHAVERPRCAA